MTDASTNTVPVLLDRLRRDPLWLSFAIGLLVWVIFSLEWQWAHYVPDLMRWFVFVVAAGCAVGAAVWMSQERSRREFYVAASLGFLPVWQLAVFAFDYFALSSLAVTCINVGMAGAFFIGLLWVVWGVEKGSRYYKQLRQQRAAEAASEADQLVAAGILCRGGALAFADAATAPLYDRNWNPVDLEAWYYGQRNRKLRQSVATILCYAAIFAFIVILLNRLGGCQEIYEMPAGGGEAKPKVQQVQIKKIIREKYVINPFSSVIFNPPPIDEVQPITEEMTKHLYQIGQGKGEGAGYSKGTFKGKVRFIRLKYDGGDWDQDMGIGGDLNMLLRFGVETSQKIAEKTEYRTIAELDRFPKGKSPPFVYMTGQRAISLSNKEVKILREFLLDKHGMIFADNGGSSQWHGQFFSMMNKVLEGTGVYPVRVPLDDVIHRIPFTLPFLPYVAPHGGKDAWGWYKDGRWLAYYHPGDIGDAWADGHAGIPKEYYEACYMLGVNVIFYAHVEYNNWLKAQNPEE